MSTFHNIPAIISGTLRIERLPNGQMGDISYIEGETPTEEVQALAIKHRPATKPNKAKRGVA